MLQRASINFHYKIIKDFVAVLTNRVRSPYLESMLKVQILHFSIVIGNWQVGEPVKPYQICGLGGLF